MDCKVCGCDTKNGTSLCDKHWSLDESEVLFLESVMVQDAVEVLSRDFVYGLISEAEYTLRMGMALQ